MREEHGSGALRKYAYLPTPDHRYTLELGLNASAFSKEWVALNSHVIINTLAANNPSIEQTRIFDITGHLTNDINYVPDGATRATLKAIISNRSGIVITQPATGKSVTYLFIDLKNKEYGSDISRIVEITYNKTLMDSVFARHYPRIAMIVLLGLIAGCGAAFVLSRFLSKPIRGIVTDVDRIAKGELDLPIASTDVVEFQVLEQSINRMVTTLREALDIISENEAALMANERKYRDLYISARIALFEINLTSKTLVSGNQYLCNLFEVSSLDEMIGAGNFQDYANLSDLEEARSALFHDGFLTGYKIRFRSPVTGRVFWGEVSVRIKNNVDVAEGSIIDITAREEAEEKLLVLYAELETRIADRTSELKTAQDAYQRENTKLNLLNAVTRHYVLNQLTVLNGYLALLEMRVTPLDPQIQEFITPAEQAVRNIERQILFTKTYQDIGVHAPTWQNVEGLIRKAKMELLPESVSLILDIENLEIYADPLLEKTFYTLLDNALRHGVHVTEIRFSYHLTDDEVLNLVYEDNGVGISLEDKAHIFQRGYGKNTGFGLFLAREFLSITGLVITENGKPGKGARFEIAIPKEGYRFVS